MGVEENLDVVRRGYDAFNSGDADTLVALIAPDAVHQVPGNAPTAGAHKGVESILGMYGQLAERSGGTMRVDLEDLCSDGGDRVAAIHVARAQREGKTLETREVLVFTVVDGRIVEIQDFFPDIAANDEFWS